MNHHLITKLRSVPHRPGVYLMRDRLDRIIYVGKARDLRKRLANYFTPSSIKRADLKTRALIESIHDFEYHLVKSDTEAILFEGKLIKEWRPKYNISFRDDKRFPMVRVRLSDPFPRFEFVRLRKEDGARYFGPFPNESALRKTVRALIKQFGIRSCHPLEPTEKDFKHCLDHVIQNCSAPCIQRVSREEYQERVLEACRFLEGKSRSIIEQVTLEMKKAAEQLDFEKAASLRNLLRSLEETAKPTRRFTRKSLPVSIDPEADLIELQRVLCLPYEPRVMECFDISNLSKTHCVASMVQFRNGIPEKKNYRRYRITSTQGQDDFIAMAEVVRRRYARLLSEVKELHQSENTQESLFLFLRRSYQAEGKHSPLPDLIIVDGGRGQLSVACRELRTLGLSDIPIIGLAKEFEEIYTPQEENPKRLDKNNGALRLLQRIRDEAHRIANGYHEILLKRRISQSTLDMIPGISDAKKKLILRTFGSVHRLGQRSFQELADHPKIGPKLAALIKKMIPSSTPEQH